MKRSFLLLFVGSALTSIMIFTINKTGTAIPLRSSGAPSGYAGDPAGGNRNCSNCHGGGDATMQSGWITSTIPETGYIPETVYTISAKIIQEGNTKFGFEVSPQNSEGTILGTLANTGNETQLTSNTGYITHTSLGTDGNGSKTWSFNWTAPNAGSGPVTFYGAFNAANGNGGTSGDIIYISTLTANEATAIGFKDIKLDSKIAIYPNPVCELLTIENYIPGKSIIELTSINGNLILREVVEENVHRMDLSSLPKGIYFVSVNTKGIKLTEKIIKY